MGKQIDKYIVQPWWWQIMILIVSLFAIGIITNVIFKNYEDIGVTNMDVVESKLDSILHENSYSKQSETTETENKFWYILSGFLGSSFIGESKNKPFAFIISFFGWILCTGLLIAIITNAYNFRIKKVQEGRVRYLFRDHCIVLGNNEMLIGLIKKIRNSKGLEKNKPIVILSEHSSTELRSILKDHLNKKEEKKLYIFRGQRDVEEQLNSLHLNRASSVYILGECNEIGTDSANIESVRIISELVKDGNRDLQCYLFLKNPKSFELLKKYDTINPKFRSNIELYSLNYYENWARKIFSVANDQDCLNSMDIFNRIRFDSKKKDLRFVILGFNRMGQAVANQLARIAHFGNGQNTIITVVDSRAEELKDIYLSQLPGFKFMPDVKFEFIQNMVGSQDMRNLIDNWIAQDEIMAIAVCFKDTDMSLSIGLNLPQQVYQDQIPVLIRQHDLHGFAKTIQGAFKTGIVSFFGMVNDSDILNFECDEYAKSLHNDYLESMKKENRYDLNNPSHQGWSKLAEHYRWSNRYPVDVYPVKQLMLQKKSDIYNELSLEEYIRLMHDVLINYFEVFADDEDKKEELTVKLSTLKQNVADDIELMGRIEHNRWIAEKVLAGWSFDEERDDMRYLHPDIRPYDELTERKKMYDREPSVKMFELELAKSENL